MKRFLVVALLLGGIASVTGAQTISPLVTEYKNKASGSFQIQNNTLKPLIVTVTAAQFSLDKEGQHFRAPDSTTHIELFETSARLSPLEIHTFSYKVRCDVLPCAVGFLSDMVMGRTASSLQVQVVLGTSVYICTKTARNCRLHAWEAVGLEPPQSIVK